MQDVSNSKELKVFVKSVFVLIGLFAVLSYGVAALLLHFDRNIEISRNINTSKNIENDNKIETIKSVEINKNIEISKNSERKVFTLILILIILPVLVFIFGFFGSSCLMKTYYDKLYGLSNNEGIIFKIQQHIIKKLKLQKKIEMKKYKIHKSEALIESFFTALKSIKPDSERNCGALLNKLEEIINLFLKCIGNNGDFSNGGGI